MRKFEVHSDRIKTETVLLNEIGMKTDKNLAKFSLFLGAGSSISSEIPSGEEVIEILRKKCFAKERPDCGIHKAKTIDDEMKIIDAYLEKGKSCLKDFKAFVKEKENYFKSKIDGEKTFHIDKMPESVKKAYQDDQWNEIKDHIYSDNLYGFWFEEYSEDERERQKFIERLIGNKEPQGAYILFANIVGRGIVKNIFTTNFDDLINDALLFYTHNKPRVYSHNETAKYINIEDEKPNIIKLHGDYLFENIKNVKDETQSLDKNMELKFSEALEKLGLVVAGYNGSDYSIMNILEKKKLERNFSLYWCTTDIASLNWRVVSLINSTKNSFVVKIEDFDTFIFKLWNKYQCGTENLTEKGKQLDEKTKSYIDKFNQLTVQPSIVISIDDKIQFNGYTFVFDYFNKAYNSKDPKEKIELYSKAIRLKPDDAEAYNNRGAAYCDLKEYEKTINDFNKVIELKPDYYIAYNNRGIIHYKLKEYNKAIHDFNKAIELKPDYEDAYNNRGILYCDLKEYEKAINDFNKAIELKPDYEDAYNNRGILYHDLKEYQKAINDYDKAIELKPDNAEAYNNRGNIYTDLKEYDKAMNDYNKAIELKPDYADAYNNRGDTYRYMKNFDSAIADVKKATEFDPENSYSYGTFAEICGDRDDDKGFYQNIEIALQKGYPVEQMFETEAVYEKYKERERFKEILRKYRK